MLENCEIAGDIAVCSLQLQGVTPIEIANNWRVYEIPATILLELWRELDARQNPFLIFGWDTCAHLHAFVMVIRALRARSMLFEAG